MGCRICGHTDREAIESGVAASSLTRVASAYGVSETALARHLSTHLLLVLEDEPPPTRRSSTPAPASHVRLTSAAWTILDAALREVDVARDRLAAALERVAAADVAACARTGIRAPRVPAVGERPKRNLSKKNANS